MKRTVWLVMVLSVSSCASLCGVFGEVVTCSLTNAENIVETRQVGCSGADMAKAFPHAKPHEIAACEYDCAMAFAAR